ncbi:P-loop containing nucleoside triphosphate hydrolase protein, partial [Ramicandelaber brevisporus]
MPQVLVLVGLPGSGKSCFSRQLIRFLPHWQRINQEEVGNREMCETLAAKYLSEGQNVVIDRVNFDEDQRKVWIHIAESHRAAPDALFFDIPLKECKERVKNRKGHASGVEGKGSGTILDRFDKAMVRPTIYEGFRFIHNISHH